MSDREAIGHLTGAHADIQVVLDLAAQAGVRYSLVDPTPSAAERDGALGLAGGCPAAPPVPDAKTIWLYREHLTRAGALGRLQVPRNMGVLLLPPYSPK